MAWWRKRQATRAKYYDGDAKRQPQRAPIPAPREEIEVTTPADSPERWDVIKRDLLDLDPDFFGEPASRSGMRSGDYSNDMERPADGVAVTGSRELTDERLTRSLRRLNIRYLVDEAGALLAMWERHVVQIRREGPEGEILVLRARAYATLPADWNDRAFRAVNEWNRTRRFLKAYVGEATDSGAVPLYGETQIPLRPGVADDLLDEFIDCAAAVSGSYIDWLHGEAGVL